MQTRPLKVGMAEMKITQYPNYLVTNGLGSCVGVCLWDTALRLGGMVHVMLPDSSNSKCVLNKAKYADTGIRCLFEEMLKMGAKKSRLIAKIAGGAQMFNFPHSNNLMRIGERNVEAVKRNLEELAIRLLAEDTGGSYGRTIEFFTADARLIIRTINQGEKTI